MLLTESYAVRSPAAVAGGEEGECRICAWVRRVGGDGAVECGGGGFSLESEHDLAVMVSDFLENSGSSGNESRCSSDSDSGFSDLHQLSERVHSIKRSMDQIEMELSSAVKSLLLSISENDLFRFEDGQCNTTCIRLLLVKGLRVLGFDAALCNSKWQGIGKVPGGDHEYIDVIFNNTDASERIIIDIDFRSHFEIARAIKSYNSILKSLPAIFVGLMSRLQELLPIMVEAAKCSLKQNSMPLPPWRSLAYLQAKWESKYERKLHQENLDNADTINCDHSQCNEHLRRLKASLQSELDAERLLKPILMNEKKRRIMLGRPYRSPLSG